jgi:hypothetical protein
VRFRTVGGAQPVFNLLAGAGGEMALLSVSTVTHIAFSNNAAPLPQESCARMKARQCEKLAALRAALVAAGFVTAASQAHALGLSRSSAWKVLKGDHKQSGLSASTINRMLASPALPSGARAIIEEYVREKLQGAYGHQPNRLKKFREKLSTSSNIPISRVAE